MALLSANNEFSISGREYSDTGGSDRRAFTCVYPPTVHAGSDRRSTELEITCSVFYLTKYVNFYGSETLAFFSHIHLYASEWQYIAAETHWKKSVFALSSKMLNVKSKALTQRNLSANISASYSANFSTITVQLEAHQNRTQRAHSKHFTSFAATESLGILQLQRKLKYTHFHVINFN